MCILTTLKLGQDLCAFVYVTVNLYKTIIRLPYQTGWTCTAILIDSIEQRAFCIHKKNAKYDSVSAKADFYF